MTNILSQFTNSVKHWYVSLIIGVFFILLGLYVFTVPLATYLTLSILFSISFIFSGIIEIFFSIENKENLKGWGWYLTGGIFTLMMGIYLIMYPAISMAILPFFIGFTMLFRSFQLLGFAFDLKDLNVLSWGNVAIFSSLGIVLSLLLLGNPLFTGISLVTVTALSFIFVGIASVIFSFSLKKIKDLPKKLSNELKVKINALQEEIKNQTNN